MPASPILTLKIVGPLGERECYVDFEDSKEHPTLLLQHVMRNAEELTSMGSCVRTTYVDDEGDVCTLMEQTVPDALFMAKCSDSEDGSRVLEIQVQESSPRAAGAFETETIASPVAVYSAEQGLCWAPDDVSVPAIGAAVAKGGGARVADEVTGAAPVDESVSGGWSDLPTLQPGGPLAQLRAAVSQVTGAFRFCAGLPTLELQHAFLDVCKSGDFARAKRLVKANPLLINVQPGGRWSALHQFALRGNKDAVQFFLDHGADPTAKNSDGKTPPEVADPNVVELFVLMEQPQGDPIELGPGLAGEPESPTAGPPDSAETASPGRSCTSTPRVVHTFRSGSCCHASWLAAAAAAAAEPTPDHAEQDSDACAAAALSLEQFLEGSRPKADEVRRQADDARRLVEQDAMKHAEEVAKLMETCASLQLENAQLSQTCSSLQEDNLRLTEACGSLRTENSALVVECHSLQAENQRLQGSSALAARTERAEATNAEAARVQHRLEHELEEAVAHNNDLLAQNAKIQASLQQAVQESDERGLQVDWLQRELAAGHAAVDCLEKELAAARAAEALADALDEAPGDTPDTAEVDALPHDVASAKVLACEQLVVGVEVQEDESARGDITEELKETVAARGAQSAYRVASVYLDATTPVADADGDASGEAAALVPVCAQVQVENDGIIEWPATAAVVLLSGPDLGLPLLPLGALASGEVAEIILDLLLPSRSVPSEIRTTWAVADAATGSPLGPLLVFDAAWRAA